MKAADDFEHLLKQLPVFNTEAINDFLLKDVFPFSCTKSPRRSVSPNHPSSRFI
ncbi:hypothetical protein PO124_27145 [Bacillus licheniformis]|nr:hypothetical protein [Bacillus licheniformis]